MVCNNGRKRRLMNRYEATSLDSPTNTSSDVISKLSSLVETIGRTNYIPKINNCLQDTWRMESKRKVAKRTDTSRKNRKDFIKRLLEKEIFPMKFILENSLFRDILLEQYPALKFAFSMIEKNKVLKENDFIEIINMAKCIKAQK
uniref:Uncharacterized protein n=1 Tax=Parastrongyloides trichosuri TaxID=131310 RepID=A0A0N4Z653_PARTI